MSAIALVSSFYYTKMKNFDVYNLQTCGSVALGRSRKFLEEGARFVFGD